MKDAERRELIDALQNEYTKYEKSITTQTGCLEKIGESIRKYGGIPKSIYVPTGWDDASYAKVCKMQEEAKEMPLGVLYGTCSSYLDKLERLLGGLGRHDYSKREIINEAYLLLRMYEILMFEYREALSKRDSEKKVDLGTAYKIGELEADERLRRSKERKLVDFVCNAHNDCDLRRHANDILKKLAYERHEIAGKLKILENELK